MNSKIAFVDIDTQVDFIEPSGLLYASGAEAIKPQLKALVDFAENNGIPLVSSMDSHASDAKEFDVFPAHCVRGTAGQKKITETQTGREAYVANNAEDFPDPKSNHVVIEKDDFPVFTNPIAEKIFAATEAQHFYVFGVVTEVCVKAAVLGLLERGYTVSVVEDAVWPITQEAGAAAIAEMQQLGMKLTSANEAMQTIAQSKV